MKSGASEIEKKYLKVLKHAFYAFGNKKVRFLSLKSGASEIEKGANSFESGGGGELKMGAAPRPKGSPPTCPWPPAQGSP